jgi:hypothetical protein
MNLFGKSLEHLREKLIFKDHCIPFMNNNLKKYDHFDQMQIILN